jgi:ribose transport system substrate-binding protein
VAGRAMVELLNGQGKIALITHPAVESGQLREKGFREIVSASPGIVIVDALAADGQREKAYSVAQDLVQSHPDLNAIFAVNDPCALGAMSALEKANVADKIKIIGFDGQPEARQEIKAGQLYATVMQHPKQIASETIDNIAKYLGGEKVQDKELLKPVIYRQADAANDADLH